MSIDRTKLGLVIIAWAFFLGLVGFGMNPATLLMIFGTVIYLLL